MLDVSANYPNTASQTFCPICKDVQTTDNQEHLLVCPELSSNQVVLETPEYQDLFTDDIKKQSKVAAVIEKNFKLRKEKLREISSAKGGQVNQMCSAISGC